MDKLIKRLTGQFVVSITLMSLLVAQVPALALEPSIPSAPSNISAVASGLRSIIVSWTDNAIIEDGFYLAQSTNGVNFDAPIQIGSSISLTGEDSGVLSKTVTVPFAGTTYWYQVAAYNGAGTSAYVTMQPGVTTAAAPAPAAPQVVYAQNPATNSLTAYWTDNATDEEGFEISRSTNGVDFFGPLQYGSSQSLGGINTGELSLTVSGLTPNTPYWFRVRAFTNGGKTFSAAATSFSSTATLPLPLIAPTNISVSEPTVNSLKVSWSGNASFYNVEESESGGSSGWITGTSYVFSNLQCGRTYSFRVQGKNGAGVATDFASVSGATSACAVPPPAAPQLSSVSALPSGATSITVSWQGTAVQYKATNVTDSTNSGWLPSGSYTFTSLKCGTTYTFEVIGKDAPGTLTAPITASTATQACAPAPPPPPQNPPALDPSCPALAGGKMVKVTGQSAIYTLNSKLEVLYFPTGDEFKSWNADDKYGGYIKITQTCYDSLPLPKNYPAAVNYRPGSYLLKKAGSSQLHAVLPNNTVAKITPPAAAALYGSSYKVMTVSTIFWPHYVNTAPDITTAKPPAGMLVRASGKIWYVDVNNTLREVTSAGFTANRFRTAFVHDVTNVMIQGYQVGSIIDLELAALSSRISL